MQSVKECIRRRFGAGDQFLHEGVAIAPDFRGCAYRGRRKSSTAGRNAIAGRGIAPVIGNRRGPGDRPVNLGRSGPDRGESGGKPLFIGAPGIGRHHFPGNRIAEYTLRNPDFREQPAPGLHLGTLEGDVLRDRFGFPVEHPALRPVVSGTHGQRPPDRVLVDSGMPHVTRSDSHGQGEGCVPEQRIIGRCRSNRTPRCLRQRITDGVKQRAGPTPEHPADERRRTIPENVVGQHPLGRRLRSDCRHAQKAIEPARGAEIKHTDANLTHRAIHGATLSRAVDQFEPAFPATSIGLEIVGERTHALRRKVGSEIKSEALPSGRRQQPPDESGRILVGDIDAQLVTVEGHSDVRRLPVVCRTCEKMNRRRRIAGRPDGTRPGMFQAHAFG